MSENFDPFKIDQVTGDTIVDGDITKIEVVDPDGHPNRVLDRTEPFDINVEWCIEGTNGYQIALGAEASTGGDGWQVMAYGESMGPGPELLLETKEVAVGDYASQDAAGKTCYSVAVTVPANKLDEHLEDGASGVYKIVVVVFLNWQGAGGEDMIGFEEEKLILMESLA